MHIYFSGVGGVAIGPLARIAHSMGYEVTGSNDVSTRLTDQISDEGISVTIGQSKENIQKTHQIKPIDWFVYTSALPNDHPELEFVRENAIKSSKRDEFINEILKDSNQKLIAIAGTHGKTSTTAMMAWIFIKLGLPVSYSIGTSVPFGPNGVWNERSKFFIYEADEYDRNFLNFEPYLSILVSVDYDHPDTYPSIADYKLAFKEFAEKSQIVSTWESVAKYINYEPKNSDVTIDNPDNKLETPIKLFGEHNRQNAHLVIQSFEKLGLNQNINDVLNAVNEFPGTERRMEKLSDNIYTDYAHHPVEIMATLKGAKEISQKVVAVYQPHQNIRQHEIKEEYKNCFEQAEKIFWLPTYLSRENDLPIIQPQEFIDKLSNKSSASPAELNENLAKQLIELRNNGYLIVCMSAGDLDDWARNNLA